MSNSELSVGDRLIETNKSDVEPVIVYEVTDERADEFVIESLNKTVYEYTGYGADSMVIRAVFESTLRNAIPNWAFLDEETFVEKIDSIGLKIYAYQEDKLARVNNGFVNGVTINISGVAEPLNQKSGAYMYTITSKDKEVYSNAEIVNSEAYSLEKSTVIYLGLVDALQWINKNEEYEGVLIRTEEKIVINQLTGEYDVRNEFDTMLFESVESYLEELSYWNVHLEPRYNQEHIIEIATETFRNKEKIKQEIEIN